MNQGAGSYCQSASYDFLLLAEHRVDWMMVGDYRHRWLPEPSSVTMPRSCDLGVDIVSATNWGPVPHKFAIKRAAARRAWNLQQMRSARIRRFRAIEIVLEEMFRHGSQAEAARILGVSRSTVCRAVKLWFQAQQTQASLEQCAQYTRITNRLNKRKRRSIKKS